MCCKGHDGNDFFQITTIYISKIDVYNFLLHTDFFAISSDLTISKAFESKRGSMLIVSAFTSLLSFFITPNKTDESIPPLSRITSVFEGDSEIIELIVAFSASLKTL